MEESYYLVPKKKKIHPKILYEWSGTDKSFLSWKSHRVNGRKRKSLFGL